MIIPALAEVLLIKFDLKFMTAKHFELYKKELNKKLILRF